MNTNKEIREQAEVLLGLSNSMLSAAIGGYWEKMHALDRQRSALFGRILGVEKVSGADRRFLVGIMEHIRIVDAATRERLDAAQGCDDGDMEDLAMPAGVGADSLARASTERLAG